MKFFHSLLVLVPLVFGLLIDGIRHELGLCLKRLFGKEKGIIKCFCWITITQKNIKDAKSFDFTKEIYEQYQHNYHMFEFGYNIFLSNAASLLILSSKENHPLEDFCWVFFLLAIVGLLAGIAYKKENDNFFSSMGINQ